MNISALVEKSFTSFLKFYGWSKKSLWGKVLFWSTVPIPGLIFFVLYISYLVLLNAPVLTYKIIGILFWFWIVAASKKLFLHFAYKDVWKLVKFKVRKNCAAPDGVINVTRKEYKEISFMFKKHFDSDLKSIYLELHFFDKFKFLIGNKWRNGAKVILTRSFLSSHKEDLLRILDINKLNVYV